MEPTPLLVGKSTTITGGATGIGRAIAIGFLRHGASVCINHLGDEASDRHVATLRDEVAGLGVEAAKLVAVAGDVADPATGTALIAETVQAFGRVDVFVTNAGVCRFAEFLDIDATLYSSTVRTNLDGAFYATQAAARQMVRQGDGGSIIGVASISALVGGGLQTHYTPTKAGVLSLMQSCAVALGKYGIRCNALLPGTIRTQLNERDLEDEGKRRYMEGRIPLGRVGVTRDMVGPAVFLASDLSGYVSGAQLLVDGGLFVNLQ
ncbi:MAG: L-rhamnose-1-dehydrogenase [Piccolia ochrophora]|nr:MAG: L-rhamnose-1-dehydrogenase [Piccolia ochrophora]